MKISIVGTAGRKDDATKLNIQTYMKMLRRAANQLNTLECSSVDLVSGGAAWADHLVVSLWLIKQSGDLANPNYIRKLQSLTLHLPSKLTIGSEESYFTGNKDADIANYYHKKFSLKMGRNEFHSRNSMAATLTIEPQASASISDGFFARNRKVAQADYLIAFTFSDGEVPKDGGTKNTWDLCKGERLHIPIHKL